MFYKNSKKVFFLSKNNISILQQLFLFRCRIWLISAVLQCCTEESIKVLMKGFSKNTEIY